MAKLYPLACLLLSVISLQAQNIQRCASIELLQQKFNANKQLQLHFEQERTEFNKSISSGYLLDKAKAARLEGELYEIPVVIHIVLPDPSIVTDEMIYEQLNVLNQAYSGTAADSTRIPSYFKSLAGKSIIQFCLAQQTPTGAPSKGIDRVKTTKTSFSVNNEGVKHASLGGVDSWDNEKYMNIWITAISGGILGYSSFPGDGSPNEHGVVIDYRALPGGAFQQYNNGKTLVHETGHFFNLYHIWGDDNGACTGTDYVDDTPGQANSTTSCSSGKIFDKCTPSGNGIMYQDYMDYTEDECLVMFTVQQVARMEAAVVAYYGTLINSGVCNAVLLKDIDAAILNISSPAQRLCAPGFNATVKIQDKGKDTLTSCRIIFELNNGVTDTVSWRGSLSYLATAEISSNLFTVAQGNYLLQCKLVAPNEKPDEDSSNNNISANFQYYPSTDQVNESFEQTLFPSAGWDIVKNAVSTGWERTTAFSRGGNAAALLKNPADGSQINSLLRLPQLNLSQVDSAWLSFSYTLGYDSLQLLISTDCGVKYNTIYEKANYSNTTSWIRDSVNLSGYIDKGDFIAAFRAVLSTGAVVYLDDVVLRKVIVNPNLKAAGFLVTPNPVSAILNIQFYPQPATLSSITIYSMAGQKMRELRTGLQSSLVQVDVAGFSPGMYVVLATFPGKKMYKKFIKVN